jgi:lipopolysaccharide transport system ATP-binding protein
MATVISIEHLSKLYRLGEIGTGTLSNDLKVWWAKARGKRNPLATIDTMEQESADRQEIWALKDVNFQIRQGEVLGIIGRNGAGKSTLLKVLSRITAPSSGQVKVKGRIASLLEVGTGFHPELTGRDNIYLNGAILGMSRSEVRKKFDEIVDFSEVEKFVDTPVKRYSSGMYVRLAFAVAAHLEPEIMMVDEVLAVGDTEFQNKCLGKMGDVAKGGRTVLFVSHNMAAVQSLCTHGVVMDHGRLLFQGNIDECVAAYVSGQKNHHSTWKRSDGVKKQLTIDEVSTYLTGQQPKHLLHVAVNLRSYQPHKSAFMCIDITNAMGSTIMQATPRLQPFISHDNSQHTCEVEIDLPPLVPGRYSVTVWVGNHNASTIDEVENCVYFDVDDPPTIGRIFPYHPNHGFIVPMSKVSYNGMPIQD